MNTPALSRFLRIVNIAIGITLVVVLSLVYWYAWRPLPQHSGTIRAPIAAAGSVTFDNLGVPHIRAASQDDALFLQGYVTAQDRLFQMDALRRFSSGDLAEVIGPASLEVDEEARRLRIRRIAESAYLTLPPADRAAFAAYARGVNYFIATHLKTLPLEFSLLQYEPRPWSAVDSLLVCIHMFRDLTTSWNRDVAKRTMLAQGDAAKVNFLFAFRSGGMVQPGSNAWAISGAHSATGKPLLSNDMHLQLSLPGIWYMTHLTAPGLDVSGVALPGAPGIIVGHNRNIAWGITNLEFDVQDLYSEKIDDRTGRYLYKGQLQQAQQDIEVIRVKGQAPVELRTWVTRHGPVFLRDGNDQMALRWSVAEPGLIQFPILDINRATNWQEFTTALERFPGPGSNFVYADTAGNIGYHAAGKLPVRHGFSGDLPLDGQSGSFEWDGFIPFEQMPSTFNPPSGIIATANQNPFPDDFPYPVNGNFAPPYRVRQIRDLLNSRPKWKAGELLTVQKDVYSGFEKSLAAQIVAAYDKRNTHGQALDDAVKLLRGWNGQMERDLAAPIITDLTFHHLQTAIAENASPGNGALAEQAITSSLIERLFTQRPAGWFADYDTTLLRAFLDAMEEGYRKYGHNLKHWKWGSYLNITVENPVVHRIPWIGKVFDLARTPMSGSSTSVKQTTQKVAPSMRMDAAVGDWDQSVLNIPFGQSGQVLSSHYRDEWEAYYSGRSFPMQFANVKADGVLQFQPQAR